MVKYLFLLVIFTKALYAQDQEKLLSSDQVSLTIVPHICIAPRGTTSCISSIDIIWESTSKGNYCLNSSIDQKMLACWKNKSKGTFIHKLVFSQNIIYKILDSLNKKNLVQETMIFKKMKPQRQYNKRHKRFPWSINAL